MVDTNTNTNTNYNDTEKINLLLKLEDYSYQKCCISKKIYKFWTFYDSSNNLSKLQFCETSNTWDVVVYKDYRRNLHKNINIESFLQSEINYIEMSSNIDKSIIELSLKISEFIGNITFQNFYEMGWNYQSNKMHIKIFIHKYKSPDKKIIQLHNFSKNEWIKSVVDKTDLLKFLKKYEKQLKQPFITDKELVDATQTLQLNNLINVPINEFNKLSLEKFKQFTKEEFFKIPKKEISEKHKNLFIKHSLEKRIYIQSCITPELHLEKYLQMKYNIKNH